MKLAYHIRKSALRNDPGFVALSESIRACGIDLTEFSGDGELSADMLLSIGGDGTFLESAKIAAPSGVPVLGVNFGTLGFLSEYSPEDVLEALKSGSYSFETREMLCVRGEGLEEMYALNEVCVSRNGAELLSVDVTLDGVALPTYRADAVLVSTPSGSTAYNLSAGGPICTPGVRALILAPVAPHNLNFRPLVVPHDSVIRLEPRCKRGCPMLSLDNRMFPLEKGTVVEVCAAPFELRRVRLPKSNFIQALQSKLLWGVDTRNI